MELLNPNQYIAKVTFSELKANYPASLQEAGAMAVVTDLSPEGNLWMIKQGDYWRPLVSAQIWSPSSTDPNGYINFGGTSATYSQSGNTITVTQTAHGMTDFLNDADIYLTQGTGSFVTEWCSNFTYVDADTFTCVSTTSQTTSGNLGTNTAATFIPFTYTVPTDLALKNDVVAIGFLHRAKNSAGTKVLRCYFNVIATSASDAGTSLTTGGLIQQSFPASQAFWTPTTFIMTTLVASPQAAGDMTYTTKSTLASAADWHWIAPALVTLSLRHRP